MITSFLLGFFHAQKLTGKIKLADSFTMKFEEAIQHLKSMVPIKKEDFEKLSAHLKYRAFTIARVSNEDLIKKVKEIYTNNIQQGKTKQEALKEIKQILPNITYNHISTHYNNNTMIAYNAGRIKHFKESSEIDYLMYNAIMDKHTTELCRKLHGTVKPKDDPFWDKFYPPLHHNCRSVVYPIHKSQLNKRVIYTEITEDGKLKKESIKIKPSNITEEEIIKDPILSKEFQFRGNPEKAIYEIPDSLIDRAIKHGIIEDLIKTAKNYFCKIILSYDDCEETLKAIFKFSQPKIEEFKQWIEKIINSDFQAKGEIRNIGWINKEVREKIKQILNYNVDTNPIISVNDKAILHLIRDAKKERGATVPIQLIYKIPEILHSPEAILIDKQSEAPVILYVYPTNNKKAKFVVKLSRKVKVIENQERKKIEVNLLTSAGLVESHNLKSSRYLLIEGEIE